MRIRTRAAWAGVVLLALGGPGRAQPADVRARAEADAPDISYSGSARITLTVEGPAPLLVELPKELLTPGAGVEWRAQPVGAATREPLPGGRERWRLVVRVRAYPPLTGELTGKRSVAFSPVQVNRKAVTWEPVEFVVRSEVDGPRTPPRLPVGVEEPPRPPEPPAREPFPVWAVVAVAAALVAGAGVVVLVRRWKAPPVPPEVRARAELAALAAGPAGEEMVAGVAAAVRGFIERRFGVPATRLTTTELAAAAGEQGWPVEQTEALRALLDECDWAKFAGDVPDDDGCRRLVRRAEDWIDHIGRAAGPG